MEARLAEQGEKADGERKIERSQQKPAPKQKALDCILIIDPSRSSKTVDPPSPNRRQSKPAKVREEDRSCLLRQGCEFQVTRERSSRGKASDWIDSRARAARRATDKPRR